MSLAGQGVVAIWNDVLPEGRADFFEWHNREHMPERVGIPGFRRGRRYIALSGTPEFFTLYETDSPEVLAGADYLARLNNPTPWTRRATAPFRNVALSPCRVALSLGTGQGGLLATLRVAAHNVRLSLTYNPYRILSASMDLPEAHMLTRFPAPQAAISEDPIWRFLRPRPGVPGRPAFPKLFVSQESQHSIM
jgi:hypothetical protein